MARTKAHEKLQAEKAAAEAAAAEAPKVEDKATVPKVPKVPKIQTAAAQIRTSVEGDRESEMNDRIKEDPNVQVTAVYNRMRNPYTGAVFSKGTPTDVIGLDSDDNAWTRKQIVAGVLMLCPPPTEDEDTSSEQV